MFKFKNSSNSSKRKSSGKGTTTPTNSNTPPSGNSEMKIFPNVPSVSQIAPLPENQSHGMLPVLSREGRDEHPPQLPSSENDRTANTTNSNTSNGRLSVGESAILISYLFAATSILFRAIIDKHSSKTSMMIMLRKLFLSLCQETTHARVTLEKKRQMSYAHLFSVFFYYYVFESCDSLSLLPHSCHFDHFF